MRAVIYQEQTGCWHWELQDPAGQVLARSVRPYDDRGEVLDDLRLLRSKAVDFGVFDRRGNNIPMLR
ncbi:MAG TPA: hypothetical protein VMR43_03475 [Variovorax sp.]|nr:hypothetical protein [Variovorax sp.]